MSRDKNNYATEFAQSLNSFWYDPLIVNNFLKNINVSSSEYSKDDIKKIIAHPQENEWALRKLSWYLYYTQLVYKRMVHYLSDILTFDWYPIPINVSEEDTKKSTFKKDYETMLDWFDKFDVKKEFSKALLKMCLEDAYFVYLRKDKGGIFLQEMPIDWCIIDGYGKFGYMYSFNLTYFQQMGSDINGFAPEFKTYYNNMFDMKKNNTYHKGLRSEKINGRWMCWQQISPDKGWVFKFHNHFIELVPPLMGIFLDFADIPESKELQRVKSALETYKLVLGAVPRNKDGKSGSKTDNFAIDPDTLAKFMQLAQSNLPKGVDIKALPLENFEMFSFDTASEIKSDPVGRAINNIFAQAGIDKNIFNTSNPNVAVMALSKLVDGEFVKRIYSQFADFCMYHVNRLTRKYKFKIVFEGTIFDREDRKKHVLELAQNGVITPQVAAAEGMSIKDLMAGMELMRWLGFVDKLTPIKTSYTMSNKDSGGRPAKDVDDLTDSGVITRTAGSNIEKE